MVLYLFWSSNMIYKIHEDSLLNVHVSVFPSFFPFYFLMLNIDSSIIFFQFEENYLAILKGRCASNKLF